MTETPHEERVDPDRMHTENLRDLDGLRRSATDRKVAGVAGGLGRHLNIDPTILRVAFVVLCFFGGAGFVLYGAAWLFIPDEGTSEATISTSPTTRNALLIAALVVAGLLLIGDSWDGFGFPWPLVVIGTAVLIYVALRDRPARTVAQTTDPQAPVPPWMPPAQPAPVVPPRDRGRGLFGITLALVALALGVLGLYDTSGGSVAEAAYPALALAVIGAVLVVGAWVGRAGGLILLGIVAAIALAFSSVANPGFDGDRRIDAVPASAALVRADYFVPAGAIRLDLRRVRDLDALDGRLIELGANAGELVVILPDNVGATVDARISMAGEASLPGRSSDGTNVHLADEVPAQGIEDAHVTLNLRLVVGHIEVRHS